MTDKVKQGRCPVCDNAQVEITDEYHRRLCDLQEDLRAQLAALAEAHAKGEHETGQGT